MATYDYKCGSCGQIEEHSHSMKEDPTVLCPICNQPMKRMVSQNFGGFVLKGGTPTTHWREKRQRIKKSEKMAAIQENSYGSFGKVRPNIAGVETDSWSDAQKLAKEAGFNHESYKPLVEKEGGKKIVVPTGK